MVIKNLVLIGGGTGFIGNHLGKHLISKGYAVQNVSRQLAINNLHWNFLDREGLPEGTKIIINLTGRNALDVKKRWNPAFQKEVYDSRIDSAKFFARLIDKAKRKPELFINISGISGYKPDDNISYDEQYKIEGFDYFSKLCVDWENAAQVTSPACRHSIVRCGVVLGTNGGIIKNLYLPFSFGFATVFGKGSQYFPWIHINDLCRTFDFIIENKDINGVVNAVAPQQVTNFDFAMEFSAAFKNMAPYCVPETVLNWIFSKERATMMTTGPRIVPRKLLESGFKFSYPELHGALKEIVTPRL